MAIIIHEQGLVPFLTHWFLNIFQSLVTFGRIIRFEIWFSFDCNKNIQEVSSLVLVASNYRQFWIQLFRYISSKYYSKIFSHYLLSGIFAKFLIHALVYVHKGSYLYQKGWRPPFNWIIWLFFANLSEN